MHGVAHGFSFVEGGHDPRIAWAPLLGEPDRIVAPHSLFFPPLTSASDDTAQNLANMDALRDSVGYCPKEIWHSPGFGGGGKVIERTFCVRQATVPEQLPFAAHALHFVVATAPVGPTVKSHVTCVQPGPSDRHDSKSALRARTLLAAVSSNP